jgi:hypothetical protein
MIEELKDIVDKLQGSLLKEKPPLAVLEDTVIDLERLIKRYSDDGK